jgi:polysaccharide pyruvyl transferase WcaK-like protein
VNLAQLDSRRVLIVGWYGTETVGDKAVLWGVVNRLRSRQYPPTHIYVSSLYPFITEYTKRELALPDLHVVETYSAEFEALCETVDEIVLGGGPLMDLEALNHMLFAFSTGARRGKVVRIEGCGIGPLQEPTYIAVVRELVRLADPVTFRDKGSVRRCFDDFGMFSEWVPDPAQDYLLSLAKDWQGFGRRAHEPNEHPKVSFFLRDWPQIYAGGIGPDAFSTIKASFEAELTLMMQDLVLKRGCDISMLPMSTFIVGGDDRALNRRLAQIARSNLGVAADRIQVERMPIAPAEIALAMRNSMLCVCMRYHSVFFAETLGLNYIAIDYTGGGKIRAFLNDRGKTDRLISLSDFAAGRWRDLLHQDIITGG